MSDDLNAKEQAQVAPLKEQETSSAEQKIAQDGATAEQSQAQLKEQEDTAFLDPHDLELTAEIKKRRNKRSMLLMASMVLAGVMSLMAAGYFITTGIRSYLEQGVREIVVEGLHALEENDLDTASNRFINVLKEHPEEVICADYLAWIEARKGNLDSALKYARMSFAVPEHTSSYELMGYLALCGKGKAVGAQAALYYFDLVLKNVPKEQYESKQRAMLSYALKLCQTRADYLLIVKRAAKAGLAHGILLRGDVDFLGEDAGLSPKSALISWQEARRAGEQGALVRIAMLKWYGYGCERNLNEASELLGEGVRRNIPEALYDQALITLRQDDSNSSSVGLQLLTQAANLGYAPALSALGILTLQTDLSDRSRYIAWSYFERASHQGEFTASAFYAFMLYTGLGQKRADPSKARAILYEMRRRGIRSVEGIYDYIAHYDKQDNHLKALKQMAVLCAAQLYGDVCFDEGDPVAKNYAKLAAASFNTYYTPMREDKSITSAWIKRLGHNYVDRLTDPADVVIDGEHLYSKAYAELLTYYNPLVGAKAFSPELIGPIVINAPALPEVYDQYHIEMHRINAWAGLAEPNAWYMDL